MRHQAIFQDIDAVINEAETLLSLQSKQKLIAKPPPSPRIALKSPNFGLQSSAIQQEWLQLRPEPDIPQIVVRTERPKMVQSHNIQTEQQQQYSQKRSDFVQQTSMVTDEELLDLRRRCEELAGLVNKKDEELRKNFAVSVAAETRLQNQLADAQEKMKLVQKELENAQKAIQDTTLQAQSAVSQSDSEARLRLRQAKQLYKEVIKQLQIKENENTKLQQALTSLNGKYENLIADQNRKLSEQVTLSSELRLQLREKETAADEYQSQIKQIVNENATFQIQIDELTQQLLSHDQIERTDHATMTAFDEPPKLSVIALPDIAEIRSKPVVRTIDSISQTDVSSFTAVNKSTQAGTEVATDVASTQSEIEVKHKKVQIDTAMPENFKEQYYEAKNQAETLKQQLKKSNEFVSEYQAELKDAKEAIIAELDEKKQMEEQLLKLNNAFDIQEGHTITLGDAVKKLQIENAKLVNDNKMLLEKLTASRKLLE